MRNILVLFAVVSCAFAVAAADGSATVPAALIVDRDGAECPDPDHRSIQAAVDAATAGDVIVVCPDLYVESVVVDKPLTLVGNPDAVETLDCFQPTLPALSVDQLAIVDPPGDGFSIAFKLEANAVELAGFVVQGASVGVDTSDGVGVDTSDGFSGYRVHHNLIRLNTLFGIDFGSNGPEQSRVDHNCIRENRWGLVSELDDDSTWRIPMGTEAEREQERARRRTIARDLRNARIDHNSTYRNSAGLEAAGPGERTGVTFDSNVLLEDSLGIGIQNSTDSAIVENDITTPNPWPVDGTTFTRGILMGGKNVGLEIRSNRVHGGLAGIAFELPTIFIDRFPFPSERAVVADNVVTEMTRSGISVASGTVERPTLVDSDIEGNKTNFNGFHGIVIAAGNSRNRFRANDANGNGGNGIYSFGATNNTFDGNSMHGNGSNWANVNHLFFPVMAPPLVDARDNNRSANTWTGNQCRTDSPPGTICGVG